MTQIDSGTKGLGHSQKPLFIPQHPHSIIRNIHRNPPGSSVAESISQSTQ